MATQILRLQSRIPHDVGKVFSWHERPGVIARLIPPWRDIQVVSAGGIRNGKKTVLKVGIPGTPFSAKWVSEHEDYQENASFTDVQRRGPFAYWKHQHTFEADGEGCLIGDQIQFKMPFGALSHGIAASGMKKSISRDFSWRQARLANDLNILAEYPRAPMRVLVSGSTGLVGSELCSFLFAAGFTVVRLRRGDTVKHPEDVYWNESAGFLNPEVLEGLDGVVHLAGANVAGGRWSPERKKLIANSRVGLTTDLADALAKCANKPDVLVSASASGYYGKHSVEVTERSKPGDDFLANVCIDWEAAALSASEAGIRVVHPRFGVVLSPAGGMLQRLLPVFKLAAGGRIGTGKQAISWISIDDAIYALYYMLVNPLVIGPINVVSPQPVSNRVFTETLGDLLRRPTLFPVPEAVIRTVFGEMGNDTILASQSVIPERLLSADFPFTHRTLSDALRHVAGLSDEPQTSDT